MINVGGEITYLGSYNGGVTWDYTPFPGLTVLSRPLRTYRCGLGWIAPRNGRATEWLCLVPWNQVMLNPSIGGARKTKRCCNWAFVLIYLVHSDTYLSPFCWHTLVGQFSTIVSVMYMQYAFAGFDWLEIFKIINNTNKVNIKNIIENQIVKAGKQWVYKKWNTLKKTTKYHLSCTLAGAHVLQAFISAKVSLCLFL
jgi:hypothetical protein